MIKLIDLEVYKVALEIGDEVWDIVIKWDHFNRDTLGKQFTNAADSIALNIGEGYGRFHFKENKNFNYYARGSAFESTACLRKAHKRKLVSDEVNTVLRKVFERYFRLENAYINSIGKAGNARVIMEDSEVYNPDDKSLESYLSNEEHNESDESRNYL